MLRLKEWTSRPRLRAGAAVGGTLRDLTIGDATGALVVIVTIGNMITSIIEAWPLWQIVAFNAPIVLIGVIIPTLYRLFDKRKRLAINGWLMAVLAVGTIAFGNHGNLTAAIAIVYATHYTRTKRFLMITIILSVVALMAKATLSGFSAVQAINYLAGHAFIVGVYFIDIRPKPKERAYAVNTDDEELAKTANIIKMKMEGARNKEIAPHFDVTPSGISQHLTRACAKYGARSDIELALMLYENGHLSVKCDKPAQGWASGIQ